MQRQQLTRCPRQLELCNSLHATENGTYDELLLLSVRRPRILKRNELCLCLHGGGRVGRVWNSATLEGIMVALFTCGGCCQQQQGPARPARYFSLLSSSIGGNKTALSSPSPGTELILRCSTLVLCLVWSWSILEACGSRTSWSRPRGPTRR